MLAWFPGQRCCISGKHRVSSRRRLQIRTTNKRKGPELCICDRTAAVTFPYSNLLSLGLMWVFTADPEGRKWPSLSTTSYLHSALKPTQVQGVTTYETTDVLLNLLITFSKRFGTHLQGKMMSNVVIMFLGMTAN